MWSFIIGLIVLDVAGIILAHWPMIHWSVLRVLQVLFYPSLAYGIAWTGTLTARAILHGKGVVR